MGRNQRGRQTMRDSGKQTEGYRREGLGGWGSWLMGIKECKCWDEHWVLYTTNESLNTTSKTNDVLYVG